MDLVLFYAVRLKFFTLGLFMKSLLTELSGIVD